MRRICKTCGSNVREVRGDYYCPACCQWLGKKETQLLPETKEECKRYLIRLLMMGDKLSADSEVLNGRKEMREAAGELIAEGILRVNGKRGGWQRNKI